MHSHLFLCPDPSRGEDKHEVIDTLRIWLSDETRGNHGEKNGSENEYFKVEDGDKPNMHARTEGFQLVRYFRTVLRGLYGAGQRNFFRSRRCPCSKETYGHFSKTKQTRRSSFEV